MKERVRAIIKKGNEILLIHRIKKGREYWVFPGGGVENGEDLETAMKRECKEELGVEIKVIENFTSERFDRGEVEQLEHFYFCDIVSGELGTGDGPEYDVNSDYEGIHEIEWLCINDLLNYDLRPKEVASKLLNIFKK